MHFANANRCTLIANLVLLKTIAILSQIETIIETIIVIVYNNYVIRTVTGVSRGQDFPPGRIPSQAATHTASALAGAVNFRKDRREQPVRISTPVWGQLAGAVFVE
jgi:hypothetical protein